MQHATLPTLILLPLLTLTATAQIADTGGDVLVIPAPFSVQPGDTVSKDNIFVFEEDQALFLKGDIDADASTPGMYDKESLLGNPVIPQGTWVSSYYVHFDAPGASNPSASGSITFERKILGVIEADQKLKDSETLGAPGTDYPGLFSDLGYEMGLTGNDWFEISDDQYTLRFGCQVLFGLDDLRVVTEGPPPGNPSCRIQVVVVIDTSGSMGDELDQFIVAYQALPMFATLMGIDLRTDIYGITSAGGSNGIYQTLLATFGADVPGSTTSLTDCGAVSENWADGTSVVAAKYPWLPGFRRVIVPISDESPFCQSVIQCDTGNDVALTNAADQCNQNNVSAWPMLGTGTPACIRVLADLLADRTGGATFDSTVPGYDYAAGFEAVIDGGCDCTSPMVHYSFDQAPFGWDSSGKDNHGVLFAATPTLGLFGGGLFLDGWNGLVEFTTVSDDLDLLGEVSVSAWIRPTGPHTPDGTPGNCQDGTILTKGGNYWFQVTPNNDGLLFQNTYSGIESASVTIPIPVDAWTHVAAVRTLVGSGYHVAFYVNGTRIPSGTETLNEAPFANLEPLTLGMASVAGPDACEFNGKLDEVMIFGCALTPEEVYAQYHRLRIYVEKVSNRNGKAL
jgi:Concanavalin A-like lectin/glucanases superfamily